MVSSRVVEIDYGDRHGNASRRVVEPAALVVSADIWYLVGHCRLRDDIRVFRVDRIESARLTGEIAPERDTTAMDNLQLPGRRLALE